MLVDITASNPIYPNPITFSDIAVDVEFIYIDTNSGYIHEGIFNSEPFGSGSSHTGCNIMKVEYSIVDLFSDGAHHVCETLRSLGVTENTGGWEKAFLIKNCSEERKRFAAWLRVNDFPRKEDIISFLENNYPEALEP